MPTTCIEEVRARIEQALGVNNVDWWLDEAVRVIEAYEAMRTCRRVYDVSTVGARLRTAREVCGLSQTQFSRRLKIPQEFISKVERGKRDVQADLFARWCLSLGITQEWALGDSEEGGPPTPRGILRRQKHINHQRRTALEQAKVRAKADLERIRGLRPPKEAPYKPAPAPALPKKEPCPRCGEGLYGAYCIADGCGYPGASWQPSWLSNPKQDHDCKSP